MCRLFIDYVRLLLQRRSFLRIQFLWKLDPQTNQRGVSKDKLYAQQFLANLFLFVFSLSCDIVGKVCIPAGFFNHVEAFLAPEYLLSTVVMQNVAFALVTPCLFS